MLSPYSVVSRATPLVFYNNSKYTDKIDMRVYVHINYEESVEDA